MPESRTPFTLTPDDVMEAWLSERLTEERLVHALGARQKAIDIAKYFRFSELDQQRAALGAFLAYAAIEMPTHALHEACQTFEIPPHDRRVGDLLHPLVAAEIVQFQFGIVDPTTLNAIRFHATGRSGMSWVEKIVYIADKMADNVRNPLYTQKIASFFHYPDASTLDRAVLYIMDTTMAFQVEKGQLIQPRTLEARNDLVLRLADAPAGPGLPFVSQNTIPNAH